MARYLQHVRLPLPFDNKPLSPKLLEHARVFKIHKSKIDAGNNPCRTHALLSPHSRLRNGT
jgi:hypothetical protein